MKSFDEMVDDVAADLVHKLVTEGMRPAIAVSAVGRRILFGPNTDKRIQERLTPKKRDLRAEMGDRVLESIKFEGGTYFWTGKLGTDDKTLQASAEFGHMAIAGDRIWVRADGWVHQD